MMILGAVKRILDAEKAAKVGGVPGVRNKIIATMAASFSQDPKTKNLLLEYIFGDLSSRADLAFSWLYANSRLSKVAWSSDDRLV